MSDEIQRAIKKLHKYQEERPQKPVKGELYYYLDFHFKGERIQQRIKGLQTYLKTIDDYLKQLTSPAVQAGKERIATEDAFTEYIEKVSKIKLMNYPQDRQKKNLDNKESDKNVLLKLLHKHAHYWDEIDNKDIQALQYEIIQKNKRTARTFNLRMTFLQAINNWIISQEIYLPSKAKFTKLKEVKPETTYFTQEQIEKIKEHSPPHLKSILEYFFLTGLRLQNFKIKWADIDIANREIKTTVKQNEPQLVPITKPLARLLLKIRRHQIKKFGCLQDYVFLTHLGKPYATDPGKSFDTAVKKAGIEMPKGVKFHSLRHSHGTFVYDATKDIKLTQESLGHKDLRMTMRYVNLAKKEKATRLNNVFNQKNKTS